MRRCSRGAAISALAAISWVFLSGCSPGATRTIVVTATPQSHIIRVLNPALLVLTLNDVPTDSIETEARYHSNRQVASKYDMSLAELQARGRLTSYETSFERKQSSGLVRLDDVVAAWKTAGGAHWDYTMVVDRATHAPDLVHVRHLQAADIGDERTAISFHVRRQPANITDYAVIFHRGRYRVYLQAVGFSGTVEDAAVLKLARTIDRRILNEGQ
jgi:hypothetical protein